MANEIVERTARAICANSPGGFCRDVGGDLGCKNGRGAAPHWSNCVATSDQLGLSGNTGAAQAAIEAMREPSYDMESAGFETVKTAPEDGNGTIFHVWQAMIDAALNPSPAERLGDTFAITGLTPAQIAGYQLNPPEQLEASDSFDGGVDKPIVWKNTTCPPGDSE